MVKSLTFSKFAFLKAMSLTLNTGNELKYNSLLISKGIHFVSTEIFLFYATLPTNQHISLKDQSSNNAIVIKEAEKRLAITMIIKEDYVADSICVILKISSLLSKNYPGLQCACVMDNLIS